MRNHPATVTREESSLQGAILAAIEGQKFVDEIDGLTLLGVREKRTPATKSAPERTYHLEGFAYHPVRERFYLLGGGANTARTLIDGEGNVKATAGHRGLSPAFREWIAAAVAADLERQGF